MYEAYVWAAPIKRTQVSTAHRVWPLDDLIDTPDIYDTLHRRLIVVYACRIFTVESWSSGWANVIHLDIPFSLHGRFLTFRRDTHQPHWTEPLCIMHQLLWSCRATWNDYRTTDAVNQPNRLFYTNNPIGLFRRYSDDVFCSPKSIRSGWQLPFTEHCYTDQISKSSAKNESNSIRIVIRKECSRSACIQTDMHASRIHIDWVQQ